MEGPFLAQQQVAAPFFYYNPEGQTEVQKHGHFSQFPSAQTVSTDELSISMSRPSSSSSQVQAQQQAFQSALTPVASPRPFGQKPTILVQDDGPHFLSLDTECIGADMFGFPSTPPLSTSGSTINSPPSSCGMLPTPINGPAMTFSLEPMESTKDMKNNQELQLEHLAGGGWSRSSGSPPMTPVFVHPPSVTASQASELLTACPSLSPSPSPNDQIACTSRLDFDFCDPRNLIVSKATAPVAALALDFPPLPTLCTGDDEEHKYVLGGEPFVAKSTAETELKNEFEFSAPSPLSGLPSFDNFSELDSEDDFVSNLVNFPATDNAQYNGSKRQRTDTLSFDDTSCNSFLSEDDFDDFETPLSPPDSRRGSEDLTDAKSKKRSQARKSKKASRADIADTSDMQTEDASTAQGHDKDQAPADSHHSDSSDGAAVTSGSDDAAPPTPAPTTRRGRKQSLTDDPSKTFVCHLCSRRFRRQEHLKRHYRSLHTQEKPFECNECGKTFSRSDNLSQHARTHGSGAIVMGVLEDGELPATENLDEEQISVLGHALYEAARNIGTSSSSEDSDDSLTASNSPTPSDNKQRKKRKRDE